MRVELAAVKATIEVAMDHEIDLDENVPIDIIDRMAELHAALARIEKEGA